MRRFLTIGVAVMAAAATLPAQRGVHPGRSASASARTDPRVGAGRIRVDNVNILYPGSPTGGQPGSILTPGTPRSPAASPLPATPGAPGPRPPARRPGVGRPHGRSSVPIYGYGYGGVYLDSGSGPTEVTPEQPAEGSDANVITVPPREEKAPPRPRVYDVRESADGRVEMLPVGASPSEDEASSSDAYSLVALHGGLIYAVGGYEQRQETFRFTTLDGKRFVVPLAEVDMEFTKKLNGDLGRPFTP